MGEAAQQAALAGAAQVVKANACMGQCGAVAGRQDI